MTLRSGMLPFRLLVLALVALSLAGVFPAEAASADYPRENAVVRAVKAVSPAVVNISSEYETKERSNPFSNFGMDPFFEPFFKDFFEHRDRRQYKQNSLGSGVIIDGKRGYILTNEHVIAGSSKIRVTLMDERAFEAELVGAAPDFDLAVLRIDTEEPLPAIPMGSSEDLMIGETVIAIGNPFGFSHTVTTGVISALDRSVQAQDRTYRDFIQTDTSINPGNSGGPLLNINGELIGINTAIYAKAQGIGFAIPIRKARRVVDDLIKYGEIHLPWLGLTVQDLDRRLAQYFEVPHMKGVLASDVPPGSPAQKAGLQTGDIITAVGDKPVASRETYLAAIRDFSAGDIVPLTAHRDGKSRTLKVHSRKFPDELAEDLAFKSFGIRVEEISESTRRKFEIQAESGVLLTEVRPGCYLDRVGVRPGDVVRRINEVNVDGVDDFKKAVVKYRHKESAVLVIQRGYQQYYVTLKTEAWT